jgi:Vitamin B12 dependent methionine synthase, activation domain
MSGATSIFTYNFKDLRLDSQHLYRAMGYDRLTVPELVYSEIEETLAKGEEYISAEGGFALFESGVLNGSLSGLMINGISLGIGKTVFGKIKKSTAFAVFVCTAGKAVSERSRILMGEGDLLRGYIFDLLGSVAVESAMDLIQKELQLKVSAQKMKITNRYSPGYCGWDLSEQKNLFRLIPERFCGIELTDSCFMQPIKSVSGIIGIGKSVKFNRYTCNLCEMEKCLYKNIKGNYIN